MSFTELLAALPYNATTNDGTGFLAPYIRGVGHLVHAVTWQHIAPDDATPIALAVELDHAYEHWCNIDTNALSDNARNNIVQLCTTLDAARAELPHWDRDSRQRNLNSLAHRALAVAAKLDRELLGYANSDPGRLL